MAQQASRTVAKKADIADALSDFQSSGDPVADAQQLKALLSRLDGEKTTPGEARTDNALPDFGTMIQLPGGFELAKQLLDDLLGLFDHLEKASEIDAAQGSN